MLGKLLFQLRQNIDLNSILANDLKKIYLNYTVFEDTGNKPPKIVCSFPMCFIDIGIQQIHSIFVRSVTYSNVTLNDRMNEHIHIKKCVWIVVSFTQYSHSTFFDFDVKTARIYWSRSFTWIFSISLTLSPFLALIIMCVYNILFCFCFALRAFVF